MIYAISGLPNDVQYMANSGLRIYYHLYVTPVPSNNYVLPNKQYKYSA